MPNRARIEIFRQNQALGAHLRRLRPRMKIHYKKKGAFPKLSFIEKPLNYLEKSKNFRPHK